MHFNFRISELSEKKEIISILKDATLAEVSMRSSQWDFPEDLAIKINSKSEILWDDKLDSLLSKTYLNNRDKMNFYLNFFDSFWKENDKKYFDVIEKTIGEEIPKYNVSLSYFISGSADWFGFDLCTSVFSAKWSGEYSHVYGLLFETILSHFFKKIKNKYNIENNQKIWIITELVSFVILHCEFDIFDYIEKTYYEEVDSHIGYCMDLYKNSKNIDDFLDELLKLRNL